MNQELNRAKLTMRPVSKNIPFVKSERALADFARQDVGVQQLFNLEEEYNQYEMDMPEYSDSEADSLDMWPKSMQPKSKKNTEIGDFKM